MTKPQVENALGHRIDNDSLVVPDFVLQVNNPLVFEVAVEEQSEVLDLLSQCVLVVIVIVVFERIVVVLPSLRFALRSVASLHILLRLVFEFS